MSYYRSLSLTIIISSLLFANLLRNSGITKLMIHRNIFIKTSLSALDRGTARLENLPMRFVGPLPILLVNLLGQSSRQLNEPVAVLVDERRGTELAHLPLPLLEHVALVLGGGDVLLDLADLLDDLVLDELQVGGLLLVVGRGRDGLDLGHVAGGGGGGGG